LQKKKCLTVNFYSFAPLEGVSFRLAVPYYVDSYLIGLGLETPGSLALRRSREKHGYVLPVPGVRALSTRLVIHFMGFFFFFFFFFFFL
jgi:hypothetical protein